MMEEFLSLSHPLLKGISMASVTGSLVSVSADPMAAVTAFFNFLSTPAGQLIVTDLHDVVVDITKWLHSKTAVADNGAPTAPVTPKP